MTTEEQIQANKENAKLGGVKTEEGKKVSRFNAVKHGLLSDRVLMKSEKKAELEELGQRVRADLKPKSEIELLLVDRIITNFWRLRRVLDIEKSDVLSSSGGMMYKPDSVFRYEVMIERGFYRALHELQRIQSARAGEKPLAPIAIDVDVSRD